MDPKTIERGAPHAVDNSQCVHDGPLPIRLYFWATFLLSRIPVRAHFFVHLCPRAGDALRQLTEVCVWYLQVGRAPFDAGKQ